MSRFALAVLLLVACGKKVDARFGKVSVIRESKGAWYEGEADGVRTHLDCDGHRLASDVTFHAGTSEYVAYVEASEPKSLRLADTKDCSSTTVVTDAELRPVPVHWSPSGQYGFVELVHVTGSKVGVAAGTSGSLVIHASHPVSLETLEGKPWLCPTLGAPCWSPEGDVVLLVQPSGSERHAYRVATWSPDTGLRVFPFESPPGERAPTHGWKGLTPFIITAKGPVELRE